MNCMVCVPVRADQDICERKLAMTSASASESAVGAPRDAVAAAAAAGAGTGGPSGEAAGLLGAWMVGSASASVLVSGRGNTLQPSSCCAAPPPNTVQRVDSIDSPSAWLQYQPLLSSSGGRPASHQCFSSEISSHSQQGACTGAGAYC